MEFRKAITDLLFGLVLFCFLASLVHWRYINLLKKNLVDDKIQFTKVPYNFSADWKSLNRFDKQSPVKLKPTGSLTCLLSRSYVAKILT
ncbi:hypothetical protein DHC50_04425 [Arenibacter sp. A80]|nr:hypothetical protein [Arenibacter sp. A80]RFT56884.1 hypothetical protein D0S24_04425 [Arenibacter sp. P308M17]